MAPFAKGAVSRERLTEGLTGLYKKNYATSVGWFFFVFLQEPTHHAYKTGMALAKNLPLASFRSAAALRSLYFVHNRLDWCDQSPQSVLPIVTFAPL